MKQLLTILFVLMFLPVFSQARIGNTLAQLKTEFPNGFQSTDNGVVIYEIVLGEDRVAYFLEGDSVTATGIYPASQVTINAYVERYNAKYAVISNTKWRAYFENGILEVELCYSEGKMPYFYWKYPDAK